MLPPVHRMRRSTDFSLVVRAGSRARAGRLVVHHVASLPAAGPDAPTTGALVGLVVSKAVGTSVQRHAVSRRLRAQTALRLASLTPGSGTVIRALPDAAGASSADLGHDLDRALARALARATGRPSAAARASVGPSGPARTS